MIENSSKWFEYNINEWIGNLITFPYFQCSFKWLKVPKMQGNVIFEIAVEKLIYISQWFWYLRYEARALFAKESSERTRCYIKIFWHLCFDLREFLGSYPETTGCCCQHPATFLIALITFAKSLYEDDVMFLLTGVGPHGMRYGSSSYGNIFYLLFLAIFC